MQRVSVNGLWVTGALAAAVAMLALSSGLARGQGKSATDLYLDKCAVCHGADGLGKTARGQKLKVKSIREQLSKLTADEMAVVVVKGKSPNMDGYAKELSAAQITQVVEHYRSLAKK